MYIIEGGDADGKTELVRHLTTKHTRNMEELVRPRVIPSQGGTIARSYYDMVLGTHADKFWVWTRGIIKNFAAAELAHRGQERLSSGDLRMLRLLLCSYEPVVIHVLGSEFPSMETAYQRAVKTLYKHVPHFVFNPRGENTETQITQFEKLHDSLLLNRRRARVMQWWCEGALGIGQLQSPHFVFIASHEDTAPNVWSNTLHSWLDNIQKTTRAQFDHLCYFTVARNISQLRWELSHIEELPTTVYIVFGESACEMMFESRRGLPVPPHLVLPELDALGEGDTADVIKQYEVLERVIDVSLRNSLLEFIGGR